jgi:hypothetical protein
MHMGYRDDTSPYVISLRFYVPVRFIPEVWSPYLGLGQVQLNGQLIHGLVELCWL